MKVLFLPLFLVLFIGCKPSFEEPRISLENFEIAKGFNLEVLASEPLLKAPIAMDFDAKGRMWVAQMPGFMNDVHGSGENEPTGSILILEDIDKDGVMDHSKIFLDSLVMPRALRHVYGGLLYAEPPYLWFVEIENDLPGKRVLVDSEYATDGNPEHQPNGLLLNIDNWIYNAKSNFRYQRKNGIWIKEPTWFRGQWGITNDNFGRLYFNDNSNQLLGDFVLPNTLGNNPYYIPKRGVNKLLTTDQRVYPLHKTDVNRGYQKGVLNADSLLVNVTAACSPLVYRGGSFGLDYEQNVFVCVPEANLIKRNILTFYGDSISAKQAWQGKEFLASTDESFRPVSLYNGPDGSLYIVDMHRGVIGHHAYLSPYLKKKTEESRLDTVVNFGRILKMRSKDSPSIKIPDFNILSEKDLVLLLKNKNGWIRNRAQHFLIFKGKKKAVKLLEKLALDKEHPVSQIHALYTLKGLDLLSFELLLEVAKSKSNIVIPHVIVLLDTYVNEKNTPLVGALFKDLLKQNDKAIDLYLCAALGGWANASKSIFFPLLNQMLVKYEDDSIYFDAILSGVDTVSEELLEVILSGNGFDNKEFVVQLKKIIESQKTKISNPIFLKKKLSEDNRTKGAKIFTQICVSCHGAMGAGIERLAPPLLNSEYMEKPERLALIILHGLKGPVHVNGKLYEMNHSMPGLIQNNAISDKDIADIIAYITSAFSDVPKQLKTETIKKLRNKKPKSKVEYTEEELLKY